MVESCVAYPVFLFVALVMYLCKSDGQDVVSVFVSSPFRFNLTTDTAPNFNSLPVHLLKVSFRAISLFHAYLWI